jgi:hypothetical protein
MTLDFHYAVTSSSFAVVGLLTNNLIFQMLVGDNTNKG